MKKLLFLFVIVTSLFSEPILKFYCGATMAKAMRELANRFEAQNNVRIVVIKGGSGKLYKKIVTTKDADLYLPGAQVYITNDKDGLFTYKKLIGYNRAVILVQKGNPKGIRDLNDLDRNDVRVVLGMKNHGSVGKITKKILIKFRGEEFYEKIYKKAIKAPTSLEIIQALKADKADTSINWKAAAFMDDNEKFIDFVTIPYIAPKQKLFLAVVKYSQYPDIAKKFVDFVFKNKRFMRQKGF